MVRVRLTTDPDGRICLESPYDAGFVLHLKASIPRDGREWDGTRKRWLVSALYTSEVLTLCHQDGHAVLDDREEPLAAVQDNPYALMPDDLRTSFACLYLAPNAPICVAEASYKALARVFHPDMPDGDTDSMGRINDAILTVRKYLNP